MLTLGGWDPGNGAGLSFGVLGIIVNVMICETFGFDRWRGYRVARGPFQYVAIGFQTRAYNCASTTVLNVMETPFTQIIFSKNLIQFISIFNKMTL